MYLAGTNYRLTKHGRARYLERVGQATDSGMIVHAVKGDPRFRFVWKPDVQFLRGSCYPQGANVTTGYRLVTVLRAS
jgi:hypothetical protein